MTVTLSGNSYRLFLSLLSHLGILVLHSWTPSHPTTQTPQNDTKESWFSLFQRVSGSQKRSSLVFIGSTPPHTLACAHIWLVRHRSLGPVCSFRPQLQDLEATPPDKKLLQCQPIPATASSLRGPPRWNSASSSSNPTPSKS